MSNHYPKSCLNCMTPIAADRTFCGKCEELVARGVIDWPKPNASPSAAAPEIVPFSEADLDTRDVALTGGLVYHLPEGRSVEVWRIMGEDGLCVRIFRKTNDGKISKLSFGLHLPAATALLQGLASQLLSPEKPEQPKTEEKK